MFIRKARVTEAREIKFIIDYYSYRGIILERSLDDIYKYIRDFNVCILQDKIIGIAALTFFTEDFAELRSLAVIEGHINRNIGSLLVSACIKEAMDYDIKNIFALTYIPEYFRKLDFKLIDKELLPHKIWRDCLNCKHFYDCNEEAMIHNILS